MNPKLTIGRVARAAGVNVETIRYYERMNLLRQPLRPPGGVRRYVEDAVMHIRFIKRAQELGFSLAEIGRLLELQSARSCGAARSIAAEKLALVDARLADLGRIRAVLAELIGRCDAGRGKVSCPIIETLRKP
ncbi:MAG TPA: MerR family DNA-binding protein [Burkholderiales bacterium]|nr:MerR family DNA-binding protein [Burkholderiales bacterium]